MEVKIVDYGMNGEGVAFLDNKTLFVPVSLIDETVDITIEKDFSNYANARVDLIKHKSSERVCPPCPYFEKCGGCDIQHMSYNEQLEFKSLLVKKTIRKISKIDTDVSPTIPSECQYNYRNKVSFNVAENKIGFFERNSNTIVEVDNCALISANMNEILKIFSDFYSSLNDNIKKTIRNIVIRDISNQILVGVVAKSNIKLKGFYDLLSSKFNQIGLYLIINKRHDSVVLSGQTIHVAGIKKIYIENFDIKYSVDLISFHQTNLSIQNKIYQKILDYINPNDIVVNAYSGAGLLSAIISKRCKHVYGIEIVNNSHQNANNLKQHNKIENMTNILGSVDDKIKQFDKKPDVIILDPSKKGCGKVVMESIIGVDSIIYISCNPIALAKDLNYILQDYVIEEVSPFDMFPNTKNVETIVKLKYRR
ncbi:MAG: 23S rRNA (uracil(1939)-C(5))-methyltransferase RlmD [Clostridia bacterium]|nr:23S rRNA (uracil(1939)-C(5))-methyltransferase RlmD [Clostridia bacterium]